MRKKPAALSVPLRRKEEFSLFKVSDNEYKVKISPQLLLATQRFLSRGEDEGGSLSSPLSRLPVQGVRRRRGSPCLPIPVSRRVSGSTSAPPGCPGSRDTQGDCPAPPNIQKQGQAAAAWASLHQEALVCVAATSSCVGEGTRLEGQPGDSRWAAGFGVVTLAA